MYINVVLKLKSRYMYKSSLNVLNRSSYDNKHASSLARYTTVQGQLQQYSSAPARKYVWLGVWSIYGQLTAIGIAFFFIVAIVQYSLAQKVLNIVHIQISDELLPEL